MRIVARLIWCELLLASVAWAQLKCPLPPAIEKATHATSIFSDEQEADLGDLMAERFASEFVVVRNDVLAVRLQQIGDQLVRYLPPTHFRFQFFLIEYPVPNAFSIGGGRVYISRKIVALAKSDDELAGIMAHELGHIVTRQTGIEMTRRLREVLGVTEVGDRNDIREKYFRYLDNEARKPDRRGDGDEDQLIADQVAVFAMARAGYSPHAYVDIWDRFQETHGKTGSWFSDFFGNTKPSQKRLRDMMKSLSTLPPGCAEVRPPADPAGFAKWQSEIVSFKAASLEESLPGVVTKIKLNTPLRPDIDNLKFSPDGTHLLAQDEGGIQVLTRDPFAVLFFIDAADAEKAFFTPDSRSIVFYTSSLRVETWDIASQRRISVHEMTLNQPCLQTLLSPDGTYLACLRADFSLALLEVASGEVVAQRNNFLQMDYFSSFMLLLAIRAHQATFAQMAFSPDGRYFLAGSRSDDFAFDLPTKRPLSIPGKMRALLRYRFAFVGPDRIVCVDLGAPQKSPVLRFPSGERLLEVRLNNSVSVVSPAHGNFVMVAAPRQMGVVDLDTSKVIAHFERNAGDVYDNWVVSERLDGRLSLVDLAQKKETASAQLSQSPLGALTAVAVSGEFKWLAVSSRTRGAVFDLASNTRFRYTRSFQGAWFSEDASLYADFPKFDKDERKVVRVDLSPTGSFTPLQELKDTIASLASFHGPYLLVEKPKNSRFWERKDWTYEIQDYRTQKTAWSRHFPGELPALFVSPSNSTAVLIWSLYSGAGHAELQRFPELKSKAEKEDFLIELLDVTKDVVVAKLLVKTNKSIFSIEKVSFDRDWLALVLKGNRALLYSLVSGEQKGHFFGYDAQVNAAADALAISNSTGQLQIYSLSTAQLRREYKFPSAVAYKSFSPDGHRLFAFTRDQTAYVLDLTSQ